MWVTTHAGNAATCPAGAVTTATQSLAIKLYTYIHLERAGEFLPYLDGPVCCSCMALTWRKINHDAFRFFITQLFMVWKLPCMLKMIQLESSLLPVLYIDVTFYTVTEVYKYGTFSRWEMFDCTDLRFTVSGQSKQTSKQHTHAMGNAVLLVWGLLRLASK